MLLWGTFWLVFLGTPLFVLCALKAVNEFPMLRSLEDFWLSTLFGGALSSGFLTSFLFVRLTERKREGIVREVIAFGVSFTLIIGIMSFLAVVFGFAID
jgi:hypothetical protein